MASVKDNTRKNDIEKTAEAGPAVSAAVETAKDAPAPEAKEAPKEA